MQERQEFSGSSIFFRLLYLNVQNPLMGNYKLSQFCLSSLLFQAVADVFTLELLKGNGPVP